MNFRGGSIPFWIFSDQFDGIPSHFSVFIPLKSTSAVSQSLKMQFSPIHTQRGGNILFWIFSDQFDRIPTAGWPSTCKNVLPHTSQIWRHQLLATLLLLDWSMMRNIRSLQIFTVWSYKPPEYSLLGSLFQCCLKKKTKNMGPYFLNSARNLLKF